MKIFLTLFINKIVITSSSTTTNSCKLSKFFFASANSTHRTREGYVYVLHEWDWHSIAATRRRSEAGVARFVGKAVLSEIFLSLFNVLCACVPVDEHCSFDYDDTSIIFDYIIGMFDRYSPMPPFLPITKHQRRFIFRMETKMVSWKCGYSKLPQNRDSAGMLRTGSAV